MSASPASVSYTHLMSRLGYLCDGDYFENGVEGICEGCSLPGLNAEGIFTHFAVSDEAGEQCRAYTEHQFQLFTDVKMCIRDSPVQAQTAVRWTV